MNFKINIKTAKKHEYAANNVHTTDIAKNPELALKKMGSEKKIAQSPINMGGNRAKR